jgi:CheY-like chemotaxis protein
MLRVLVVDDWQDSITSLHWLLQNWGHEAHVAADGPTALEMADSLQPDVVILDIAMPGMDGYEVAKRLQQRDAHKPFIIIHSGYCSEADVRRSLEAGCSYHFPKPVDPDDIRRLLEAYEKWLQRKIPHQTELLLAR